MATGPTLSFDQIQSLWIQNGGNAAWAPLAAAIAIAESGGNTVALNNTPATGDYSVGLWQINYFGNLLTGRTQQFGSPIALQSDPNAQAKAAIALSGNGANWGPWKGDAAIKAWQGAGSPATPSKATISGWGVSLGGAGGGASATASNADQTGAPGTVGQGTGCTAKGKIFGVADFSFSYCQGKALVGGLLVGGGGALALTGLLIVVAWGLGHTSTGRGAASALRVVPGVGGAAARALT
jgi:hypothetical protein